MGSWLRRATFLNGHAAFGVYALLGLELERIES
jgi:hypothetical protein